MSKNHLKSPIRRNKKRNVPEDGSLLDYRDQGMKAGIKWGKRVSKDLFSYAYYKMRMDSTFQHGIIPVDYFLDPLLGNILRREHKRDIDASVDAAREKSGGENSVTLLEVLAELPDKTTLWLHGWLDGIKVCMENRDEAERILGGSRR